MTEVLLAAWEESALAAAHLASSLRSGWQPPPITIPMHLLDGEAAIASQQVAISQHYGKEVHWNPGGVIAFGNPLWTALSLGGSVAYNVLARDRAANEARIQWRIVDQGVMYMTTWRLACRLQQTWADIPYSSVRASEPDADGLVLWVEGQPPTKFHLPAPDWYYVLFRFLAHGEIVGPTLPDGLRQRVVAAGKPLPPDQQPLQSTTSSS